MRIASAIALLSLAATSAFAQNGEPVPTVQTDPLTNQVTIASKGLDVRDVLFDLFEQSSNNFVLEPNVHFVLYLSLAGVEFEEALAIVLDLAKLDYELQNGIYFVGKSKGEPIREVVVQEIAPLQGRVPEADLDKKLTARLKKIDIRDLAKELTKQTGVMIEIDPDVPGYKLDAFLVDTTLRHALNVVTDAAGLSYAKTEMRTIRITKKPKEDSEG